VVMLLQKGLNYKKEKRKKKCVIILSCALVGGKLFVVPLRAAWLFYFFCARGNGRFTGH
jgi:hypothetical protein